MAMSNSSNSSKTSMVTAATIEEAVVAKEIVVEVEATKEVAVAANIVLRAINRPETSKTKMQDLRKTKPAYLMEVKAKVGNVTRTKGRRVRELAMTGKISRLLAVELRIQINNN